MYRPKQSTRRIATMMLSVKANWHYLRLLEVYRYFF